MTVKRKWTVVLVAGLAAVVLLCHAPVLRGLAGFLVADESAGPFEYVGLFNFDHEPDGRYSCDAAAELYRSESVGGILLIDNRSDRLIETGGLPSFETLVCNTLEPQGVSLEAVKATRSDGFDDWAKARAIRAWLSDRPNATLLVFCDRFRSAHVRYAIDTIVDSSAAARVGVRGLPDRRYDETNWWTSRVGIKAFGFAWLRRIHGWFAGGEHPSPPSAGADAYESNLRTGWGR